MKLRSHGPLHTHTHIHTPRLPWGLDLSRRSVEPDELEQLKLTCSKPRGQPTPDATARAPSSVEANWSEGGGERVGFRLKVVLAGISLTQVAMQ